MKKKQQAESQTYYLNWEVQKAAKKLVEDIMRVQKDENVLITCESASDMRTVHAAAAAVMCAGGYPIVLQIPQLKLFASREPVPAVAKALAACDVWLHFDFQLYQTKAWRAAMDAGVRQITAAEMDVEMMLNVIGRVDNDKVVEFGDRLCELTANAKEMRIKSPAGTDFVCSLDGRLCDQSGAHARDGFSMMLPGQASCCPIEDSMNGVMVFDGALYPPKEIGFMQNAVKCIIKNGVMTDIVGENRDTTLFRNWMASFEDPNMYRLAHVSYGYNPGILEPTGRIAEDERVFGGMCIGFGRQVAGLPGPGWEAKGHTDGVILNASIYIDGVCIEENGFYVDPVLKRLCEEMNVPGY